MTIPYPSLSQAGRRAIAEGRGAPHDDDPGPADPWGDDVPPPDDGGGADDAYERQAEQSRLLAGEVANQRRRRDALRRLQAEDAPLLRVLEFGEFLESPVPEPLVTRLLYKDSLARMFGPPGSGKSFVALDVGFRVALGWTWTGLAVHTGPVVYVMAEGQRVNNLRARAWMGHHGVTRDQLEGRFHAVPDAVLLTEDAARPFAERVGDVGAALVVIDTKNACMVGEESSATDFAVMRRAMDMIRKASGACVWLIDHTGYEGTRARGSSAGTAAMDTEIRVEGDDDVSPKRITVTVTRDKADEAGMVRDFELVRQDPAAVVVVTGPPPTPEWTPPVPPAWQTVEIKLPDDVVDYEGPGAKGMQDVARYMAYQASTAFADPAGVGLSRVEVQELMTVVGHSKPTVRRAWSVLIKAGHIKPADRVKSDTGRHVWAAR